MSKTVVDGTCFRCKGTGSEKAMSIKQYNFIKELFMQLAKMGIIIKDSNEWHEMVNTMVEHRDGIKLQSSKWASNKIEEYKARKNRVLNANKPVYSVEYIEPQEEVTDIY
jgi:hypothetical protein